MKEALKYEQEIGRLRASVGRLGRQLVAAKEWRVDMFSTITKAVEDSIAGLTIDPVREPKPDKRKHDGEIAICAISDWQLGKRTPTYSTAICEKRVQTYADKVRALTNIQRADRPIREARVYLLGDLVEGELIFPGQAHRIDSSLFRQVMDDGPRILTGLLRSLLADFDRVSVREVIGNHGALGGRSRREYHPESNADAMLYEVTRKVLAGEKRLDWPRNFTPGERAWYAVDKIGRHQFFLFHGDQMRGGGFAGIPIYGFVRAISKWASGVIPEGFNYAMCGHWHNVWSMPIDHRILWINGSTESGNEWLREELKAQSPPCQWLLFAHPRVGVTSEHRVWL